MLAEQVFLPCEPSPQPSILDPSQKPGPWMASCVPGVRLPLLGLLPSPYFDRTTYHDHQKLSVKERKGLVRKGASFAHTHFTDKTMKTRGVTRDPAVIFFPLSCFPSLSQSPCASRKQ